jgi:hypothetical protein
MADRLAYSVNTFSEVTDIGKRRGVFGIFLGGVFRSTAPLGFFSIQVS